MTLATPNGSSTHSGMAWGGKRLRSGFALVGGKEKRIFRQARFAMVERGHSNYWQALWNGRMWDVEG